MLSADGGMVCASLPSRERGLKCKEAQAAKLKVLGVAPFTGAWIEMAVALEATTIAYVAPFTGAWIEITHAR